MAPVTRTTIEWHDITIHPDDLPGEEDPVMITIETNEGSRIVWMDAFLYEDESGDGYKFMINYYDNRTGVYDKEPVWYKVIAWAYPPDPYYI